MNHASINYGSIKKELLHGLMREKVEGHNYYTIINDYVMITLDVISTSEVELVYFYKTEKEIKLKRKGIARCALLFMLETLLEDEVILFTAMIRVLDPTENSRGLPSLIKMYQDIGFNSSGHDGRDLRIAVLDLIERLYKQCIKKTKKSIMKTTSRKSIKSIKSIKI